MCSFLRVHQFDTLPGVQYRWWEPSEFTPSEAAQTQAAEPEQVEAAAPVGEVHHGIRSFGKVGLPVLGHITSCGQVKRVIAPAFGHAVNGRHGPSLFRPLGVAVRIAVELHPLGGEVPEDGDVSGLWVYPDGAQLSPLHSDIDALHPAHLLDPGESVFGVQNDDETRIMAGVLLLPQLQQLGQVKSLCPCSKRGWMLKS